MKKLAEQVGVQVAATVFNELTKAAVNAAAGQAGQAVQNAAVDACMGSYCPAKFKKGIGLFAVNLCIPCDQVGRACPAGEIKNFVGPKGTDIVVQVEFQEGKCGPCARGRTPVNLIKE